MLDCRTYSSKQFLFFIFIYDKANLDQALKPLFNIVVEFKKF